MSTPPAAKGRARVVPGTLEAALGGVVRGGGGTMEDFVMNEFVELDYPFNQ
jgi:hypothetical protein